MKKLLALFICLTLIFSLSACGNKNNDPSESGSGAPSPSSPETTDPQPPVASLPEEPISEITSVSEITQPSTEPVPESTQPEKQDEPDASKTNQEQRQDSENAELSDFDMRAIDCLKILNSSKVHAKLIEAVSYDNEQVSSSEREYFINGRNAVYINDDMKIVMTDKEVTVIDNDAMTYYTYEREPGEDEDNFGYALDKYEFVSSDIEADGTLIETYSISVLGGSLVSTWTFFPDGRITVSDVSKEFGSYYWYKFDLIEIDVSAMDMSIPEGYSLTEPEDYF